MAEKGINLTCVGSSLYVFSAIPLAFDCTKRWVMVNTAQGDDTEPVPTMKGQKKMSDIKTKIGGSYK